MPYVILLVEALVAVIMWAPVDQPAQPPLTDSSYGMFNDSVQLDTSQVIDLRPCDDLLNCGDDLPVWGYLGYSINDF